MSRENRNRVIALAVTVVVHVVVVVLLFMMALRTPLPLPGEAGVEVNLGMYNESAPVIQPQPEPEKVVEKPKPQVQQPKPEPVEEQIVTQDTEETTVVEPEKPVEPEEEKPVIPEKTLFHMSAPETTASTGTSDTDTIGDPGKYNGKPDIDNTVGPGGGGINTEYDLGGREPLGKLPKPDSKYLTQKGDKICIAIKVNSQGEVVEASYKAKGSTMPDIPANKEAIEAAIRAAKQSKWKMKKDDTGVLSGTITYFIQ